MSNLTAKAFWIFLGDAGVRVFGFLTTILLARTLGVDGYGLITIAIAVLGYASWFSDMGINTLGTRSIALPKRKQPYTVSTFFWTKITLAAAVLLITSLIVWGTHFENIRTAIVIQLFLLALIPHALQLEWYFNGIQKYNRITLSRLLQSGTYLVLVYLFVTEQDIFRVPAFYGLSVLLGATTLLLVYRSIPSLKEFQFSIPKIKELLGSSIALGIGSLFAQFVVLLPPLVIGYYLGTFQAGIYGAAFKIILLFMLFDRVLVTLLLPNLSGLWAEKRSNVKLHLQRTYHWVLFSGCLATIILHTGSDFFIGVLFGNDYAESASLLMILAFFLPLTYINSIFSFGLISFTDDTAFLRSALYGGIASFFVILFLTSHGNLYWTSRAVVFSELLITFFVFIEFRKHIQLDILAPILKIGLITIALLMLPFWDLLQFPITLILLPALFIIAVFLSGGINKNDVSWLKERMFS